MGNQGIDYFPMNVDFFTDDKIELIESEFGIKGSMIAIRLLCKIYHEGYYYQWGDDECLLFARKMGAEIVPNMVREVVQRLVKRSFFDERLFNSFRILTSKGIQRRYFEAVKRRKDVKVIKEYLLIDETKNVNVNIVNKNVCINDENADILKQSKVKEKKVKEIKRKLTDVSVKKDELSSPPHAEYSAVVRFGAWLEREAPYCYGNMELPTENELRRLLNKYESAYILDVVRAIENRKDLRGKYANLYRTVIKWIKMDEEKGKAVVKVAKDNGSRDWGRLVSEDAVRAEGNPDAVTYEEYQRMKMEGTNG